MPSALNKVQKSISKKRLGKKNKSSSLNALHENSRDAQRIRRAAARDDKIVRQGATRERQNEKYLNRLAYFHAAIRTPQLFEKPTSNAQDEPDKEDAAAALEGEADDINMADQPASSATLTPAQRAQQNSEVEAIHRMIHLYLSKHDAKISRIEEERRKGRPKSNEHIRAEQDRDAERSEYESGFWMIDLRGPEKREKFERWDGKWEGLGPYTFVRVWKRAGDEEWRETVKTAKFPPANSA